MTLAGHLRRGPVQSRPAWERAAAALDERSRAAWAAVADAVFDASLPQERAAAPE